VRGFAIWGATLGYRCCRGNVWGNTWGNTLDDSYRYGVIQADREKSIKSL